MAENERYDRDNHLTLTGTTTASFSHLLFAEEDDSLATLDVSQIFKCGSSGNFPAEKNPKMLCFGDYPNNGDQLIFSKTTRASQKSGLTCSDSSSSASSTNSVISTMSKSINVRKRNQELVQCTSTVTTTSAVANQKASKNIRAENPTSTAPPKRKEKLGERVAALQQLVSPFGKTDTASVLYEAMGYIRFLQEQIQVLCSPYLQQNLSFLLEKEEGKNGEKEGRRDMRSKGLCLVPVECTVHVANTNGADFWSPAMASNVSSSTKQ